MRPAKHLPIRHETKKIHSPSEPNLAIFLPRHPMNRLPFSLLLVALVFSPGCVFSKKPKKPKESQSIAADTEEGFRQRFVDKRMAELVAQGVAPEAARSKATDEFRARYEYTGAARK